MKFAIIDTNQYPMAPGSGRGSGFIQALAGWSPGKDYEFIRYDQLPARAAEIGACRGLVLSGSVFDLALPDDGFDRAIYQLMAPVYRLIHAFPGPVLGICFGHQLMALGDEFDPARTGFGGLRVRNMIAPPDKHSIMNLPMRSSLRFLGRRELWVQFHHKQEVVDNEALRLHYEIVAGSDQCPVHIMQHKSREWFGVQFHPEVGKETKAGEIQRHDAAVRDGQAFLQAFVHYCLK